MLLLLLLLFEWLLTVLPLTWFFNVLLLLTLPLPSFLTSQCLLFSFKLSSTWISVFSIPGHLSNSLCDIMQQNFFSSLVVFITQFSFLWQTLPRIGLVLSNHFRNYSFVTFFKYNILSIFYSNFQECKDIFCHFFIV